MSDDCQRRRVLPDERHREQRSNGLYPDPRGRRGLRRQRPHHRGRERQRERRREGQQLTDLALERHRQKRHDDELDRGVYYRDVANGSLDAVNASANARHGVLLRDAPGTELRNVTAVDDGRWGLYTTNSSDVAATQFETNTATLSFVATDAALTGVESIPGDLPNRTAIDEHVGMAGTSENATIRLIVEYDDANVTSANVTENSLRLWGYDRNWSQVPGVNYVNTDRNVVVANVSALSNASTFAAAGETTTPTPTTTATATATATPDATNDGGNTSASTPGTTTSDNGPGFGIALAVVALLAATLVGVRPD